MIKRSEAIFSVRDVNETIAFYRDVLGFSGAWTWGDPVTFGGVGSAGSSVMFCLDPRQAERIDGHQHWFAVEDVNGLHERHSAAGATIVSPIEDKPWGMREYVVRDPNGYHLRFAGPSVYQRPATATESLPDYVTIAVRPATLAEYEAMTAGVGWSKADPERMKRALASSLFCVVATDTRDDATIGMARVCGDGRYYTIWDVMVLPRYQGQQIGSALLETALTRLREMGPKGASVGLFTGKPKFYERFGFRENGGMQTTL